MIVAPPDSALVQVRSSTSSGATALALTAPVPEPSSAPSRLSALLRMLWVGFWSSGVDLAVLVLCVRCLDLGATLSRFVALAVSGLLLFFGCRLFAFRARAGSITRQARRFVAAEVTSFPLNLLVFHALAAVAPFVAPELSSQAANFIVFVGFSYPVRRWLVFRTT